MAKLTPGTAALTDDSPMPFGKYKGEKMQKVLASYFLWLWEEGLHEQKSPVADYVRSCFSALEMDAPDAIIWHRP